VAGEIETPASAVYRASAPLGAEKTDGLVLMCSDRRYRAASEEFVIRHLGLASYDILAVPGGSYLISFADALPKQLRLGFNMVKFVVRNHTPSQIVLIGHQSCGRYIDGFASWLRRPGFSLEAKQIHDLGVAKRELQEMFPGVQIGAYFARSPDDVAVDFERV
jgi:hypothetical protein